MFGVNHVTRVMLVTAAILPASYSVYFAGSAVVFAWERPSSGSYNPAWPIGETSYQEARRLVMERLGAMECIGSVEVRENTKIEFKTAAWSPYTASAERGATITVERENDHWSITPAGEDLRDILDQ